MVIGTCHVFNANLMVYNGLPFALEHGSISIVDSFNDFNCFTPPKLKAVAILVKR